MKLLSAVCLLLSLATAAPLFGQPSPRNPPKEEPKAKGANAASSQKQALPKSPPPVVVNQPTPAICQNTASAQTSNPNDNSSPDWVMWSAIVQAVCAAFVAVFTGVLLCYSHRGWQVAKVAADAAKVSADMAKLIERPWVTASISARSNLAFYDVGGVDVGGVGLFFSLVLKNIGRSVATDIRHDIELFAVAGEYDAGAGLRTRQSAILTKMATSDTPGFSLFPGEAGPMPLIREVDGEAVEECATRDGERWVGLCLVGAVTYRFAASDSEHVTRFAYYVGQHEPGKERTVVYLGRGLKPGEIVFRKDFLGSYAD